MTATARRIADGLRHEIDVNGRHTIVTDEPAALGGSDGGPAPHELLPAAVASCVSTMVSLYAKRHGWEIGEISVRVEYDPRAEPRRMDVDLRLPANLADDRRRRLERVAETCPVRKALETGIEVRETQPAGNVPAGCEMRERGRG